MKRFKRSQVYVSLSFVIFSFSFLFSCKPIDEPFTRDAAFSSFYKFMIGTATYGEFLPIDVLNVNYTVNITNENGETSMLAKVTNYGYESGRNEIVNSFENVILTDYRNQFAFWGFDEFNEVALATANGKDWSSSMFIYSEPTPPDTIEARNIRWWRTYWASWFYFHNSNNNSMFTLTPQESLLFSFANTTDNGISDDIPHTFNGIYKLFSTLYHSVNNYYLGQIEVVFDDKRAVEGIKIWDAPRDPLSGTTPSYFESGEMTYLGLLTIDDIGATTLNGAAKELGEMISNKIEWDSLRSK